MKRVLDEGGARSIPAAHQPQRRGDDLLGIGLAVLIVHVRSLQKSLMPWIVVSQTIPILAIAPMVVVVPSGRMTVAVYPYGSAAEPVPVRVVMVVVPSAPTRATTGPVVLVLVL